LRRPDPDLEALVERHALARDYPAAVLAEAEAFSRAPGFDDAALEDLEALPFVTIDNEDSRDLDQALLVTRAPAGGFKVWYALADASYYVRPGSALFGEALSRGSSYYLPGFNLPMLPRLLSEGLVSLREGQARRALVFEMSVDPEGRCTVTRVRRGRVRSRRKLSYERVQQAWDDPDGSGFAGEPFAESLGLLREVGRLRIEDARRRHVVRHQGEEIEVEPRAGAPGFAVVARERLETELCNEQVSLLCNVEGARLLERGRGLAHVQPIFRVHPAPTPDRLEDFREGVKALAEAHGLDAARWVWRGAQEPLSDYLERLPRDERPRIAAAIDRQAMLTNQRSTFGELPGRHHGVGAPVYARFSSPMREIVGVFTHKEVLELLRGAQAARPGPEDEALRDAVVLAANRAKALQRTLTKESHRLVMDRLLRRELKRSAEARPWRPSTLLGMKSSRLYLRMDDPPLEVKVHLQDLARQTGVRWRADRLGIVARAREGEGELRAGDGVELRLSGYAEKLRRWLFDLRPLV